MAWVSASTNEYWDEDYGQGFVYAGSGVWDAPAGPTAKLGEYSSSPLIGDPYTYEGAATVSKIKFRLSATASTPRTIYARIVTSNYNGYPANYESIPYVFSGSTTYNIEITYSPDPNERPIRIELSGAWGEFYLENPTLSLIEVYVEGGELPCCRTLYKYTGKVMSIIPDTPAGTNPPPVKPIPPPPPKPGNPSTPSPWPKGGGPAPTPPGGYTDLPLPP